MPPPLGANDHHPRLRDQTRLRSDSFYSALSLALRRRLLHAVLRQEDPLANQLCLSAQSKTVGHHRLWQWRRERFVTCRESFLCSPSSTRGLLKLPNEYFQSFKQQRHHDAAREPETDRRRHPHAHVLSLRCNGWTSFPQVFCQIQRPTQYLPRILTVGRGLRHNWSCLAIPTHKALGQHHRGPRALLCGPHDLSTPTDHHGLTAGVVLSMPVPKKSQMAPFLTSE